MPSSPTPGGVVHGASQPAPRSAWIDNLRTLVIVLVVNIHACVTYSHVGGWYLKEAPEPTMPVKIAFIFWEGHLQAFFMGLLFFLAGVFAQRSLAKRGPRAFIRERLIRLGVPSLLYMLLIHPFMVFVLLGHPHVPDRPSLPALYWRYLASGSVFSGSGPMWFALALLAFCAVLAAGLGSSRREEALIRNQRSEVGSQDPCCDQSLTSAATVHRKAPSLSALLGFSALLVISTFVVRLVQPVGTSVLNFQLCYFPQYIAAFVAGLAAGKHGWLESLVISRRSRVAGRLAIIGGPLLLAAVVWLGGIPADGGFSQYQGGWHLQAFGLAFWEQCTGLGLGLGVMSFFHRRVNSAGKLATWLSERSFAVYALHAPVLVALTLALGPASANAFVRVALLTVTGLAASYVVADIVRRLPGARRIF